MRIKTKGIGSCNGVYKLLIFLIIVRTDVSAEVFLVTNQNNAGPGSFRQALIDIQTTSEADEIFFFSGGSYNIATSHDDVNLLPPASNVTIHGYGVVIRAPSQFRIMQVEGNTFIKGMTFETGVASFSGGALFVRGSNNTIEDCLFRSNRAGSGPFLNQGLGGAIRLFGGGVLTMKNCTMTDNRANQGAAIIVQPSAVLTLLNCTISENQVIGTSPVASSIYNQGTLHLINTILANTIPEGTPDLYDVGTTIETNTNNLVEKCDGPGCQPFTFSEDPKLEPLGDYGHPTFTFSILPSSPIYGFNIGAYSSMPLVPTLGQWGVIVLAILMTIFGVVYIRNRSTGLNEIEAIF